MRSEYYAMLQEEWNNQKAALDADRRARDQARETYIRTYYAVKNGDGVTQTGTRPTLDTTRKQIRAEIDQKLTDQRNIQDQGKKSWTIHYRELNAARAASDTEQAARHTDERTRINNSWNQYGLLVDEYNRNYYPTKRTSRQIADQQHYDKSVTAAQENRTAWDQSIAATTTINTNFWHTHRENIKTEDEQIAKDRAKSDADTRTARTEADKERSDDSTEYYRTKTLARENEDKETTTSRNQYTNATAASRADFDKEFAAQSDWSNYRKLAVTTRTEHDTVRTTQWNAYVNDFMTRARAYWDETTKIRSTYNTREGERRRTSNQQISHKQDVADRVRAKAREDYRAAHAKDITDHFAARTKYHEDKTIEFNARAKSIEEVHKAQAQEMADRPTFSQYLQARRLERTEYDAARASQRDTTRATRNTAWQKDADDLRDWIDNYYPNQQAARAASDNEKYNKRKDADDKRHGTRADYYKELDSYIHNFFNNRAERRAQTLGERSQARTNAKRERIDTRHNVLNIRAEDRATYDREVSDQYQKEYEKYTNDIRRLRTLGYNQYARNKSASRAIKKAWRGGLGYGLDFSRSAYDVCDSGLFSIQEGSILAGQQLYDFGSWGHYKLTGTAYYLNILYRDALYPSTTHAYDLAIGSKRFAGDSALYLGRTFNDRMHDLSVLAQSAALPVSWATANFLLERAWNLEDFGVGSGRVFRDTCAVFGINIYRAYVPARQSLSNIAHDLGYKLNDLVNFILHGLQIGAFGIYRGWMALYIPSSEILGNLTIGAGRAIKWMAILLGRATLDLLNNLYAISSYLAFPFRFGIEYALNYGYESIKTLGIVGLRFIRDLGQLGYIAACYTIVPICRLLHDFVIGSLRLFADGFTASARFLRDRMHDLKVLLWDNILVTIGRLLEDALIALGRATGTASRFAMRRISELCQILMHVVRTICIPIGKYCSITANALLYYTGKIVTALLRFCRDRAHDLGKLFNTAAIPSGHNMHYYGTAGCQNLSNAGQSVCRGLDDWFVFPTTYAVDQGFTVTTRSMWDAGVYASRKAQDVCTYGIRKAHDASFEVHQRIDQPAINIRRSVYDTSVTFKHAAELRAKKAYDYLSDLSPLYMLERGADRVLREHEEGQDPENPLLNSQNRPNIT